MIQLLYAINLVSRLSFSLFLPVKVDVCSFLSTRCVALFSVRGQGYHIYMYVPYMHVCTIHCVAAMFTRAFS